jgi:polyisoprenoid-binding protein YceI
MGKLEYIAEKQVSALGSAPVQMKCRSLYYAGVWCMGVFLLFTFPSIAQTSPSVLEFDPSQTTVSFTLGDVLHTVHGGFALKRGKVSYNSESGDISGEIVVDATSGHSGNNLRDKKMHKDVLESAKYPEMIFRPDRAEGKVGMLGTSTVKVHGTFTVHGSDHEMTLPIQVEMAADHWTATTHFVIPYEKWGMKNPSTFILRVSESVEIDVHASGKIPATSVGN